MSQLPLLQPLSLTVSVTELTSYIREALESDELLQDVWVQGEVSNLSLPRSGHLYFTLKDPTAALRCVMWRPAVQRQLALPKNGDAIEVHGHISVYEAGGQYQLYADHIRPRGEGMLFQQFIRLKSKLEAEGLFNPERKRPIPPLPTRIGIVTSPTGAALQDILNTIRRRYPLAAVILAPTPVQGDDAPPGIVRAIAILNRIANPDVILLARGGGSIEDLWAFNDERVARAIVASENPVITGVGHETDFTIADFSADLRAPTPTAAAELATPHRAELSAALNDLQQQLADSLRGTVDQHRWTLNDLHNRLDRHSPVARIHSDQQRLDELSRHLQLKLGHRLRLSHAHLAGLNQKLTALNPQAVLRRGYAVVSHPDGKIVRTVNQVQPGNPLNVHVSDGDFDVQVS